MATFFHPNKRALAKWLEDKAESTAELKANARVEEHIATCERCAATIESLPEASADDNVTAARGYNIQHALATALRPPDDFNERLERKVTARLDSRVMFDVVTDLFGAGVEASRLLLTEEDNDE